MSLSAVLRNHTREMKRYRIEHCVPTTGNFAGFVMCRDDELTNAGAVAGLVKSLYEQMQADGALAPLRHEPSR
jgi:hypothetical protein